MKRIQDSGGFVYDSSAGKLCPKCNNTTGNCTCKKGKKANQQAAPTDGIIRISRETKGRKGAGVTLVSGFEQEQIKDIAKNLKKKCGVGGSVKNGVIELQGDQRQVIQAELEKQGLKVKICGG